MRSVCAMLVALLMLPAVAAELGTASLTAGLPLETSGTVTAGADRAWLLLEGEDGDTAATLTVQGGELVRIVQRAYGYVRPDDPRLDVTWHAEVEEHVTPLAGATLRLLEPHDGFLLVAKDAHATLAPRDQTLLLGLLEQSRVLSAGWDGDVSVQVDPPAPAFRHLLAAGLHQGLARSGDAAATGAFNLSISNALLQLDGAAVHAYFRETTAPGGLYDPIEKRWFGPGHHTEYVQEHILVRVTDGRLDASFADRNGFLLAARPHMDVLGTVKLPDATGTISVGEETHHIDEQTLELGGRFRLDALGATGDGRGRFQGDGDFTQVTYGKVDADYEWAAPIVVATLGTLILAGAAWLLSQTKALAPLGGLALYARVQGDEVLEHPARQELYERIKAHPGTHFQEIHDDVPFGASTLNYHLRVLERNGYVTRLKDGRYVRFFDRRTGAYAGARKHALSALRNETTAAIAKEILRNPGVAQCDLAARFSIAASTVNWHIRRLADAGLVEKQRDNHYTRYYGGPAWAQLPQPDRLAA